MATSYKKKILDYCTAHQIAVPPAFERHSASRYAIIRTHLTPSKLIARTWFSVADVVYYLEHFLAPELGKHLNASIRILDFGNNEELEWNRSKQLPTKGPLA